MNEPANHTAVIDRHGDTWVRVDEVSDAGVPWWPLTDGPRWVDDARAVNSWAWAKVEEDWPLTPADPDRTARAIAIVRREMAR